MYEVVNAVFRLLKTSYIGRGGYYTHLDTLVNSFLPLHQLPSTYINKYKK
jgi:hypothetical protein